VAELADAADLKSAGAILVGSSPTPGTSWKKGKKMPWLIVILGYLLGSIPTAYIAGRVFKKFDIRRVGDGNMGAQNAFRQLGAKVGVAVGIIDAAKGALVIVIAQVTNLPQIAILLAGAAAVIGHNWPVFLRFRGGRGESTTIGVLLATIPQPMLIMAMPSVLTLVISRNVTLTSVVLFVPLPFVCWWLGVPGVLIAYGIALPCLVGFTHFLRTRWAVTRQV
jgi:glycerol-3-phosphate acyltransferase PlsY